MAMTRNAASETHATARQELTIAAYATIGVRFFHKNGPVAQLGARLNGIQEVTGSIPVRSTNSFSRPKQGLRS